jgi:hypothetical protein
VGNSSYTTKTTRKWKNREKNQINLEDTMKNEKIAKISIIISLVLLMFFGAFTILFMINGKNPNIILFFVPALIISFCFIEYFKTDSTAREIIRSWLSSFFTTSFILSILFIPTFILDAITNSPYITLIPVIIVSILIFYALAINPQVIIKIDSISNKIAKKIL